MREKGMVGAAMGTTTVSRDDKWWAVPVKVGDTARLTIIDTTTGRTETILERDSIGHPQFHPDDSSLLRYAGPFYERMWIIQVPKVLRERKVLCWTNFNAVNEYNKMLQQRLINFVIH